MNKQYRLVVFDWEGTLSDNLGLVLRCIEEETSRLGYGDLEVERVRPLINLGLANALRKILPQLTVKQRALLVGNIQTALVDRYTEIYLMPGAQSLIKSLHHRGVLLAIATNKGPQGLQRAIETTGIGAFFALTHAAGQFPPKPHPAMLQALLETLSIPAEQTLMIGDSLSDIEMAVSLGVDAIGFDASQSQRTALLRAGAIAVFDDYQKLATFLGLNPEEITS